MKDSKIFNLIKDKIRQNQYDFKEHTIDEMAIEKFLIKDVLFAIITGEFIQKYTHDETHFRYLIRGEIEDGRILDVVVFFSQNCLFIKTVFEYNYGNY